MTLDPDDLSTVTDLTSRLVREAIVQAGRGQLAGSVFRPATFVSGGGSTASVLVDGDTEPITVVNALSDTLAAGDRALVTFQPPQGVFLTNALGVSAVPEVPIGTILEFGSATIPENYLECNGAAHDRTTFGALFGVIGTTWGAGNGSTTFNVPNFNGRVTLGRGGIGGSLGSTGGAETVVLGPSQMPLHSHNMYHTHPIGSGTNVSAAGTDHQEPGTSGTATSAGSSITATGDAGGVDGHNNMQPYAAVVKIIRAL